MLITNVTTPSSNGAPVSVRIEGDLVTEIGAGLVARNGESVIDGNGGLLTESLVETHAHLDKAYLAELIPNPTGDLMGAITSMIANRHVMTVENTIERGGCPHLDDDAVMANAELVNLAGDLGVPLDLHADEHTDAHRTSLQNLAERVISTGFEHGVTASHCVSLGMQDVDTQRATAEKLSEAGIGVVALPHTNLFLQGRDMQSAMPRGLTAVKHLRDAGVRVAAGSDNLQDPFNPIGRGDPLEAAGLMILTAHLLPEEAFASVSTVAREVVGARAAGPSVGAVADLMLTAAASVREMIAVGGPRSFVMRRGVVVHRH
ncbi:MAG: hydrolase [Actinobacteria bacterium]|nr:hydrolase [Actinomycetota bacterium]